MPAIAKGVVAAGKDTQCFIHMGIKKYNKNAYTKWENKSSLCTHTHLFPYTFKNASICKFIFYYYAGTFLLESITSVTFLRE